MAYRATKNTRERQNQRREELIASIARVFGKYGYHEASVPRIVAETNIAIGTFYRYFPNKETCFAEVLKWIGRRLGTAIQAAALAAGPDILLHLRAAVEEMVRFLAENPSEARILIVESSGLGHDLEALRRRVLDNHTRGVEEALFAVMSRLPPMNPSLTASCWVGSVYEAVYRWLEEPPERRPAPERLAQAITAFNLRAIGAPEEFIPQMKE